MQDNNDTIALRIAGNINNQLHWSQWDLLERNVLAIAACEPCGQASDSQDNRRSPEAFKALRLLRHLYNSRGLNPPQFLRDQYRSIPGRERIPLRPAAGLVREELVKMVSARNKRLPPVA